jgi:hypothetical protein
MKITIIFVGKIKEIYFTEEIRALKVGSNI